MNKHSLLGLIFAMAISCSAQAILVLDGEITTQTLTHGGGGSSALGGVASPVDFDLSLDIPSSAGPIGFIEEATSTLSISGGTFDVTGGVVTVKDSGMDDLVEFAININNLGGSGGVAADGQITFTFMGDLVSSTVIDSTLLDSLVGASTTVGYIDFSNSQLSNYTGVVNGVSAVPEASSILSLSLVGLGFVGWRNRKRFWGN